MAGASSVRCPICKKKQSEFNKPNMKFDAKEDFIKYGISTLHAGPNTVKAILKIASQLKIKSHRCAGKKNKKIRDKQAKKNAELLWENLGIRVEHWFQVDGLSNYFKRILFFFFMHSAIKSIKKYNFENSHCLY